jgi:hypothetical protein
MKSKQVLLSMSIGSVINGMSKTLNFNLLIKKNINNFFKIIVLNKIFTYIFSLKIFYQDILD